MSNKLPRKVLSEIRKYPDFYQKVWLECARIPRGRTISYGELAERIGKPGAARAVGNALGKNPFSPHVPCHRVIRKNGSLGGFSMPGGRKTKKRMLDDER